MIRHARLLVDRRGRRVLDRARNPDNITAHAVTRYIQDVIARNPQAIADPDAARDQIRLLCRQAKRIFRGKDSHLLQSPPWIIFYRDGTVVSVMHEQSQRRY